MLKYSLLSLCLFSMVFAEEDGLISKAHPTTRKDAVLTHDNRNGGFAMVEGFYWKAAEDGMQYAAKFAGDPIASSGRIDNNSHLFPKFEWDPGFRVGVGFLAGKHDKWNISAVWTHFNTDADNKVSFPDTTTVLNSEWAALAGPVLANFSPKEFLIVAKTNLFLHFDTVDLILGRDFFISRKLRAHPLIGLRYARITQNNRATYLSQLGEKITFTATSDFSAVGLRGGTNLLWSLSSQWGILGKLSGSLLYGDFDIHNKVVFLRPTVNNKFHTNYNAGRTNLEAALGLQWQNHMSFWSKKGVHLTFAALYEMSEWFGQNEQAEGITMTAPFTTFLPRHGDLFLQGFTLSADIEF